MGCSLAFDKDGRALKFKIKKLIAAVAGLAMMAGSAYAAGWQLCGIPHKIQLVLR